MAVSVAQASFTGGEVSPSLYARADLARYATSLRTCRNWIVQRHGGVVTRPGFRYIGDVINAGTASRLLDFSIGPMESLLVEIGVGVVRFFRSGALQPAWTLTINVPWSGNEVADIKTAQVGAIMLLTHPNHAPRELRFLSVALGLTLTVSSFAPLLTAASAPTISPFDASTPTLTHQYVVTNTAGGEESLPSPSTQITMNLQADKPATIATNGPFEANIYRGRNGVFGFIGSTTTGAFLDANIVPDYSTPPPTWGNPFSGTGNAPAAVTHYQQRRFFAGSINNPQTLYGSRASELRNFGAASPARDDDAIDATLAAIQGQAIQHLVPLDRLVVMTTRGEWIADGGDEAVLTPSNTGFNQQSAYGASGVPPVLTGEGCVYVQAQGTRVRDLVFNPQLRQFGGTDLTVLATHLFEGYTIRDLAWSSYPHSCVWAVRDDGVLLCLTYLRDQEVWGWSRHETDGLVERVCVVREGQEDALYIVVRRMIAGTARRFIERLTDRFPRDLLTAVCLDSALSYDGRNTDATRAVTLSGASWAGGSTLTANFFVAPSGLSASDVIQLFDASGALVLRARVTAVLAPTQCTVIPDRDVPTALRGIATARWALAQAQFTGLDHLVGMDVVAVVDGNVETARTVQPGGVITLANPGAVVHVGLPYTCTLETLDLTFANQGTVRDRKKVVSNVTVYVEKSRGLTCGIPGGEMVEIKQRESEPYDAPMAPFTGTHDVGVVSNWNEPGRILIEQPYPLPATVLAVIPEVTLGG